MPDAAIVDASAVLDAAGIGPRFDAFTRLVERFDLRAPELLAYETGALVHGRLAPRFGATHARRARALEAMLDGVALHPTTPEARGRIAALASRHGLTFYDASYLELAEREEGILITQDKALLRAGLAALGAERASDLDGLDALLARLGP